MEEFHAIVAKVNESDPVFEQPWEADAFVTAVTLSHLGYFEWKSWVATFAEIISFQPQRPGESAHDAYYRQWLSCLEKVLDQTALVPCDEVQIREAKWRLAYLNTPHGSPVELATADNERPVEHPHHNHHHHHHHHHHGEACDGENHPQTAIAPFRVFAGKSTVAATSSEGA